MRIVPLSCLLMLGCATGIDKSPSIHSETGAIADSGSPGSTDTGADTDLDDDGFFADQDCDDTDPTIHPEADEVCGDGVDNDCSGAADDGCPESLSTASASLMGERPGDRAGASLAPAGDVNGDGWPDLIVGARKHSEGGVQAGRAYVVFGPIPEEARVLTDLPGVTIDGTADGDGTGRVVTGLGDLDGDGFDEVMVTADEADADRWTNAGRAHVFDGATLAASDGRVSVDHAMTTLGGRSNYSWLGVGVTASPDVDGDGIQDVWVGASGDKAGAPSAGTVFLFSGADLVSDVPNEADVGEAILELQGTEEGAYVGARHAAVGDLDGDGRSELVLGAYLASPNGDSSGAVMVFSGGETGVLTVDDAWVTWSGDAPGDRLGSDVSAAGDVNGDGHSDLWIGAERVDIANADAGAALLVYGGPGIDGSSGAVGGIWAARILGAEANQGLGEAVDGSMDIDEDGVPDVVLGTPNAGLNIEGGAHLVYGPVDGTVDIDTRADRHWVGVAPDDRAGWQTRVGGDLLGTGQQTIVLSSWESDRSGRDAGEVYILGM